MIAQQVFTLLSGINHGADGVWPVFLPQQHAGFPAITYSIDEDVPARLIDGEGSLTSSRVSVDVWAKSYLEAHTVADAVRSGMTATRGTVGTVFVDHIRTERELDLYESDTGLYRVNLQFFIAYA